MGYSNKIDRYNEIFKMKKIKPIFAYAIISKKTNKINVMDIFADKDLEYIPSIERIVKVKIEVVE